MKHQGLHIRRHTVRVTHTKIRVRVLCLDGQQSLPGGEVIRRDCISLTIDPRGTAKSVPHCVTDNINPDHPFRYSSHRAEPQVYLGIFVWSTCYATFGCLKQLIVA